MKLFHTIRKGGYTRPNNALVDVSIGFFEKNTSFHGSLKTWVWLVGNCWIYHQDIMLVVRVEIFDYSLHLLEREAVGIKRKDPA